MSRSDLLAYLMERLREAEERLEQFETAIAAHGLRVYERDITDRHLKDAEVDCEEYRTLIRKWSN